MMDSEQEAINAAWWRDKKIEHDQRFADTLDNARAPHRPEHCPYCCKKEK